MTRELAPLVLAMLVALTGTGCLTESLQPLAAPEDAVLDERLVGTWTDGSDTWQIERDGAAGYTMVAVDGADDDEPLALHLTEIDDLDYLDVTRANDPGEHGVRTHAFFAVELSSDRLELWGGVGDFLASADHLGHRALATVKADGDDVLVASTEQLREAVSRAHSLPGYRERDDDWLVLERVPAP